jgi:hypothetical protein
MRTASCRIGDIGRFFLSTLIHVVLPVIGSLNICSHVHAQAQLPSPFVDANLPVFGRQLTAAEIVGRCVSKLADMDFRGNAYLNSLVTNLTNQPLNMEGAVSACMKILSHGRLVLQTDEGMEVSRDGRGVERVGVLWPESERVLHNEVALKVLRTMTAFHQNYFESKVIVNNYAASPALTDATEPAYFLSWALFGRRDTQVNAFRDILRKSVGIKAIRRSSVPSIYFPGGTLLRGFSKDVCWWNTIPYPCGTRLANFLAPNVPAGFYVIDYIGGEVLGPRGIRFRKLNLSDNDLVAQGSLFGLGEHRPLRMVRIDLGGRETVLENFHASAGGGILGTTSYMGMNYQIKDMPMDGGKVVPRKWSANVLRDFLCIQSLPNLRPDQVANKVNTSSSYEFRRAASCVACHAQVDPLAFTARNIGPMVMGAGALPTIAGVSTLTSKPVTQPAETGDVEGGPDFRFSSRPPNGELYFNNWRNTPVRVPVRGLAQLGETMSAQDDFYLCAAKRYYRFFTGVDVNIRGTEADMRPLEREHYRNVVKAGLEVLKTTQSTERMIEFIFSTPAFRYSDFRSEVRTQ